MSGLLLLEEDLDGEKLGKRYLEEERGKDWLVPAAEVVVGGDERIGVEAIGGALIH